MQTAAEAESKTESRRGRRRRQTAAAAGQKHRGRASARMRALGVYIKLCRGDELRGALAGEAAAGAFCAAGVFCAAGAGHFQNQKSNGALWRSPALRGYGGKNKRRKRFRVRGAAPSRPKISPFCGGGRRWRGTSPRTAPCSPPKSPPSSAARWQLCRKSRTKR